MDKNKARLIRIDMERAMKDIEEKHDVKFEIETGSYDDLTFSLRVRFVEDGGQEELFRQNAIIMGVNPDVYGKSFVDGGSTYKVIGINPRARKYPLIVERESDKAKMRFIWNELIERLIISAK